MRVTYLNPVGVVGGAERALLAGLRHLPRELPGFTPTLVLLADGPLRSAAEAAGATVVVVPMPRALAGLGDSQLRGGGRLGKLTRLGVTAALAGPAALAFTRRLRDALAATRPDLLVANGVKSQLLAAVTRPRRAPVVWYVHDFASERPLVARLLRRATRGVRGAVAVSHAVAADVATVAPGVSTRTVHNAIDTDHFTPGDGVDLAAPAGLPPADAVRVGLVATYANWKGQGVFLDALARVPGVRGYVVGGPIYTTAGSQFTRAELEARAAKLGLTGRVGFVPFHADPRGVYRALDIVVHASTRPEPFGLTIAEGMSCGRAVVVAAAGGAAELFTDGVDALGHPPGDAAALADAIRRLAADAALRANLGAAARRTAVERFGLARHATELAAAYRAFLGGQ